MYYGNSRTLPVPLAKLDSTLMKPESVRALDWFAGALIVTGWAVISPSAAFVLFSLAAICATFPTAFGSKMPRFVGAALLTCSISFAAGVYPQFELEREAYAARARERTGSAPIAPTMVPETRK